MTRPFTPGRLYMTVTSVSPTVCMTVAFGLTRGRVRSACASGTSTRTRTMHSRAFFMKGLLWESEMDMLLASGPGLLGSAPGRHHADGAGVRDRLPQVLVRVAEQDQKIPPLGGR